MLTSWRLSSGICKGCAQPEGDSHSTLAVMHTLLPASLQALAAIAQPHVCPLSSAL